MTRKCYKCQKEIDMYQQHHFRDRFGGLGTRRVFYHEDCVPPASVMAGDNHGIIHPWMICAGCDRRIDDEEKKEDYIILLYHQNPTCFHEKCTIAELQMWMALKRGEERREEAKQ